MIGGPIGTGLKNGKKLDEYDINLAQGARLELKREKDHCCHVGRVTRNGHFEQIYSVYWHFLRLFGLFH